MTAMKHPHYFKSVKHLDHIDVYRVLDLFGVTDNALGHAAKKIICAGIRGAKDQAKDVQEAIDTLTRWQEMQAENHIVEVDNMAKNERLKKAREFSQTEEFKRSMRGFVGTSADWKEEKELASSGIYGDDGYIAQDMQAASLVHDAELAELVELCSKTDVYADADGWIEHHGNECPVSDEDAILIVMGATWENENGYPAGEYCWGQGLQGSITHWRYAK